VGELIHVGATLAVALFLLLKGGHVPEKSLQSVAGRIVRCILFDLGETLWSRKDTAAWHQLEAIANQHAAALLREHVPLPHFDDETLGARLREALDEHIRALKRWNPEIEAYGPIVVMQILQQLGIERADIPLGRAIYEALRIRIPQSRPLFSDTLPTLAALQQRGFLLGVVTNRLYGGEPFQEDLRTLGLLNYFDPRHMAISGDLGVRKPNPAIFLHALKALNVEPEHAAMVGDSLNADILGAQKLGILAIWKPKPKQIAWMKAYSGHQVPFSPEFHVGSDSLQPPDVVATAMRIVDADYRVPGMQSKSGLDLYLRGEIRPDLIIEHLSDLLDIFLKVGVQ
jgi:HAD superfamily hydrolase (TIGR01549 family)